MQRYKLFLTQQQLEEKKLKRFLTAGYYPPAIMPISVSTSCARLAVANSVSLQQTANAPACRQAGFQKAECKGKPFIYFYNAFL